MTIEKRISTLEKIVNLLVEKDKEIDRFCSEILDSVNEMNKIVILTHESQKKYSEVLHGIIETIKIMQSEQK